MAEKKTMAGEETPLDEAQQMAAKMKSGLPPLLQKYLAEVERDKAPPIQEKTPLIDWKPICRMIAWLRSLSLRTAVVLCGLGMILIGLFPPWVAHLHSFGSTRDMGYAFITMPPCLAFSNCAQIDFGRLFIEWIIGGIACAVIIFLKREKERGEGR